MPDFSFTDKLFVNCLTTKFRKAESAEVVFGSTDIEAGESVTASQFILHEGYDEDIFANDIGLIKLETPLTLGENVGTVNLASEELDGDVNVTVSGWDGIFIRKYLNFVELVTITNEECGEIYGQDVIRPEMVCATSPVSQVKGTCNGDSGGPMVINADSDPVHVAVVSFMGDDVCETGTPSGFVRTAYYRDWIKTKTGV
ncbi:chymotrypsin BII-like [Zophobas morio]|uniref:chymotrypsin BII-like n=1 Tax=Zophobas morio TaxID=2755281 RepID=UPI003082A1F6